jgi:hypothetical protein
MLETLIVLIVIIWLLGWTVFNIGDIVHFLLVVGLVLLVIRLFQGRRV